MKKRILALVIVALMLTFMFPTTIMAHEGLYQEHNHYAPISMINIAVVAGEGGMIYSPDEQDWPSHMETETYTAVPDPGYQFVRWEYAGNEVPGAFTESGEFNETIEVFYSEHGGLVQVGTITEYVFGIPVNVPIYEVDPMEYCAQAIFAPEITVTLDLGDHGYFNDDMASTKVLVGYEGETLVVPDYTLNLGCREVGWDGSLVFDTNKTLTMQYEFEVTFDPGDGTLNSGDEIQWVADGGFAVSPTLTSEPVGYDFDYWDDDTLPITEPTIITAVYVKEIYQVSFEDENGNVWVVEDVAFEENAVTSASFINSIMPEGVRLIDVDPWDPNEALCITGSKTIYVKTKYLVNFDIGDGTSSDPLIDQWVEWGKTVVIPTIVPPEGYHFADPPFTPDGTNITAPTQIVVNYEINTYQVTFMGANGVILILDVEHGSAPTPPTPSVPEGFVFTGWDTEFEGVTDHLTVNAQFVENDNPKTGYSDDAIEIKIDIIPQAQVDSQMNPLWWVLICCGVVLLVLTTLYMKKRKYNQ